MSHHLASIRERARELLSADNRPCALSDGNTTEDLVYNFLKKVATLASQEPHGRDPVITTASGGKVIAPFTEMAAKYTAVCRRLRAPLPCVCRHVDTSTDHNTYVFAHFPPSQLCLDNDGNLKVKSLREQQRGDARVETRPAHAKTLLKEPSAKTALQQKEEHANSAQIQHQTLGQEHKRSDVRAEVDDMEDVDISIECYAGVGHLHHGCTQKPEEPDDLDDVIDRSGLVREQLRRTWESSMSTRNTLLD